MIFTNQKVQQYADWGSIVEQNKNITEINTPTRCAYTIVTHN